MDLVNQDKFKNILIIILLVINILTVSIIWMKTPGNNNKQYDKKDSSGGSVNLMKQALDLNAGQISQIEKIRAAQLSRLKNYNDQLDDLKKQLAEELFKQHPDTSLALKKSLEIGELQSKLEMVRFNHFNGILSISTDEQKDKLKPIIMDIFTRKPPKKEINAEKPKAEGKEKVPGKTVLEPSQNNNENRPLPPQMEEKISKYSKRLNLTAEQVEKLKAILMNLRPERKQDRMQGEEIDLKEANRRNEDEAVIKILSQEQKKEFLKMIEKRNK